MSSQQPPRPATSFKEKIKNLGVDGILFYIFLFIALIVIPVGSWILMLSIA